MKVVFNERISKGRVSAVSNSALTVGHDYDIMDRVTNTVYRDGAGAAVRSFAYAYDPDGLLTQQVTVADGAAVTNAYAYDGLGRLVSADGVTYAYDLSGNRLSQSGTGVPPVQSTYTHNRLDGDLYDAAGCVTNMTRNGVTLSLAWNTLGQLVSVATNGAFAESYAYDALGRRISTTSLSTINHEPSTIYHWYDGAQCVADTDASGNLLRSYAWGPGIDDLLAVTVCSSGATNSFFAIKDRLGSVCALVDSSGAVVDSYTYDAWGNAQSAVGNGLSAIGNRYLFQGREFSFATGLYNFRARWYDPASGRWLSKDPIGLEGGLNLYAFCGNDPVNCVDPGGMDIAVICNGPTEGNPIGHSAVAITGLGVYSYGNNTTPGSSLKDYINGQIPRRNSTIIIIPTTPEQDQAALEEAKKDFKKPYSTPFHNCANYVNDVLSAGGVPLPPLIPDYNAGFWPNDPNEVEMRATGATSFNLPKDAPLSPAGASAIQQFEP